MWFHLNPAFRAKGYALCYFSEFLLSHSKSLNEAALGKPQW
jgi:hypothetical protein